MLPIPQRPSGCCADEVDALCHSVVMGKLILCLLIILAGCSNSDIIRQPIGEGAASSTETDIELQAADKKIIQELVYPYRFSLKSGPPGVTVSYGGTILEAEAESAGIRQFILESGPGVLEFSLPGFIGITMEAGEIPSYLRHGVVQIILEPENSQLQFLGEIATGSQPKSVSFSHDGRFVFVPLLDEKGIDVFRLFPGESRAPIVFEKRITIPESKANGFVESFIDEKRGELWVSNMEENKLHIFSLDGLEYKESISSRGIMPKVITQNPSGGITVVSNWLSKSIAFFDSDTKKWQYSVSVGGIPRGMVFSPDGTLLYTAIFDEPMIEEINIAEKKVNRQFPFYTGTGAARHVIYLNGKLYVSDMEKGNVCILDAVSGKLEKAVRVGPNINTICLSQDGKYLFASSRGRNNPNDYTVPGPDFGTVSMLSTKDLAVLDRVWGRNQPTGLAVSPDNNYLIFTDFLDNNLELYRIKTVY